MRICRWSCRFCPTPGLSSTTSNSKVAQVVRGADAGEHQKLRRTDRASREDHLALRLRAPRLAILPPNHAGGAAAIECDALGEASGLDAQVRAVHHRLEKAARRRPAAAHALVDVEICRAFIVAAIEVVDLLDAILRRGLAERVEQIPAQPRCFDTPLPADAMMFARTEEMIGLLAEQRQHIVPAPAGEAELAPVIVIGRLPAHVDHGVDRRRAAEHLAARIVERAPVQARLGLGLEHPVGARIADREQVADRNVKPDPVVAWPPASSSSTRWFGSADSRFASTQPAEPAPTMMVS